MAQRLSLIHISGKEQSIAITASSNMSEEDIKKAVREAEQYAAEDKKKKEEVETLNHADQLIYQTCLLYTSRCV